MTTANDIMNLIVRDKRTRELREQMFAEQEEGVISLEDNARVLLARAREYFGHQGFDHRMDSEEIRKFIARYKENYYHWHKWHAPAFILVTKA